MLSVRPKQKPLLSILHKRKRLQFARSHLTYGNWSKVIYSDEKLFSVRPGGLIRCWYQRGTDRFAPKYVVKTVAHPEKVMVWAAMDASGAISIRRVTGIMNAAKYQSIYLHQLCLLSKGGLDLLSKEKKTLFHCLATGDHRDSNSCMTEPAHTAL